MLENVFANPKLQNELLLIYFLEFTYLYSMQNK